MSWIEKLNTIQPLNEKAMKECQVRWNNIAKPLHSLGKLETGIIQIAGIQGTAEVKLEKKALVVMCADNGVVEEGVTQTGQEVTAIVAENFNSGKTSAAIMADYVKADVYPIDIGIAADTEIINRKIAYGTKNILKEPAMSQEEAKKAIETGIETVKLLREKGYHIIATGEMGIGNTTTSSAVAAVLLNVPAELMTGRGAGLSNHGLKRKIEVIERAIELHKPVKEHPIDVLAKVGGLDIAGLTGVFLGGALFGVPVVMDGFISAVAALLAVRICGGVRPYLLPSHLSKEPAAKKILDELGFSPYITCDMCLGEGTGALALFPLLELGLSVYQSMGTFVDIDVDAYQDFESEKHE